jgi:hypothetical protein
MQNHDKYDRERITFGQLHERLKKLGFVEYEVVHEGKRFKLFEHETNKQARIFLPERKLDEIVEPVYMRDVNFVLKTHGFIYEVNPLYT